MGKKILLIIILVFITACGRENKEEIIETKENKELSIIKKEPISVEDYVKEGIEKGEFDSIYESTTDGVEIEIDSTEDTMILRFLLDDDFLIDENVIEKMKEDIEKNKDNYIEMANILKSETDVDKAYLRVIVYKEKVLISITYESDY